VLDSYTVTVGSVLNETFNMSGLALPYQKTVTVAAGLSIGESYHVNAVARSAMGEINTYSANLIGSISSDAELVTYLQSPTFALTNTPFPVTFANITSCPDLFTIAVDGTTTANATAAKVIKQQVTIDTVGNHTLTFTIQNSLGQFSTSQQVQQYTGYLDRILLIADKCARLSKQSDGNCNL
jgi:hypothetical protein